jgi:AraC-like DNA-binding protein
MPFLPNPTNDGRNSDRRSKLVDLASSLATRQGYNLTALDSVRLLRTEAMLDDVPVLYRPGAVFVLQGRKQGILDGQVYIYDEDHYLAVSLPVPFRMQSAASPERPLLAVYVDFDMLVATEIAAQLDNKREVQAVGQPKGLISSRLEPQIEDLLMRLLMALSDPVEASVLGASLLRELHYRVLVGPQGETMLAATRQKGAVGKIIRSLVRLRDAYRSEVSTLQLASEAGMSIASYHAHFKALTGSSPIQYLKAIRLHEARLMLTRPDRTIAEVARSVGYISAAQFSRDFKRHFGRTASQELEWIRQHLGEGSMRP